MTAGISDENLIEAGRLGNVWKVAEELGLKGQAVHRRLTRLGAMNHMRVFTEDDRGRLRREYIIFRDAGRLDVLARSMGRTKPFICTQARKLGLTDPNHPRPYIAIWKYVSDEAAETVWAQFKRSRLGLGQFCKAKGYDDLGFARAMKRHFGDEWDHVIELKMPKQGRYRLGRQVEYAVRDDLRRRGFLAVRSPRSGGPVDVIGVTRGCVVLVQCKRGGLLGVKEWNVLYDLAQSVGAIPLLGSRPKGRGIEYHWLTGRKDGSKRPQPYERWEVECEHS